MKEKSIGHGVIKTFSNQSQIDRVVEIGQGRQTLGFHDLCLL